METKKIVEEIANEIFSSSKELKNQAIAIKKIISSIQKQQRRLAKYLSPAETATLSRSVNILEPYITIFNKAAKENARILEQKMADWDKQRHERIEKMIIEDFGTFSTENLIKECKLFIAFLEETGKYADSIKSSLGRYETNPTPDSLQALKQRFADELNDYSIIIEKTLSAFGAFKAQQKI